MNRKKVTLREDVHGVVDLDIHMIAYGRELSTVVGYHFAVLCANLVRGGTVLCESPSNNDTRTVFLRLERLIALILDCDRDLSSTAKR